MRKRLAPPVPLPLENKGMVPFKLAHVMKGLKMRGTLIGAAVIAVLALVLFWVTVEIVTVEGNQLGVRETWGGGVDPTPLQPKTYWFFRWTTDVYRYDMSPKVFVMNDKAESAGETGEGRSKDSYLVQSSDQQDMHVSSNLRWRLNPDTLIEFHKKIRTNPEEKLIRPDMLRIIKNNATTRTAIDAYSGNGLVTLQNAIFKDLKEDLSQYIIVDNYAIEHIALDNKYVEQIVARQVAMQEKLAADEKTKAAQAKALQAQAEAQADLNRRVVEAERDKKVGILAAEQAAQKEVLAAEASNKKVVLAAEAENKSVILAAEAKKQQVILDGEAQMKAGEMRGAAILAIGKAEAEANKLKMESFAAVGSDSFVKIEVAKQVAAGFSNIKGYLPADMKVNMLTTSFLDSVKQLVAPVGKP